MICKECLRTIDDDSLFCTYCGSKVVEEPQTTETNTDKEEIVVQGENTPDHEGSSEEGYLPEFAYRVKILKKILLEGYIAGFVLAGVLCLLLKTPIANVIAYGILLGSFVSACLLSSQGSVNSLFTKVFSFIKGLLVGLIASFSLNPIIFILFFFKLVIDVFIIMGIAIFITLSFPLTVIYTLIMYCIEKKGQEFEQATIDRWDKVVPISAVAFTLIILLLVIKVL